MNRLDDFAISQAAFNLGDITGLDVLVDIVYSRASIFRGRWGPLDAHRGSSEACKIEMNGNGLYADRTNT